MNNLKECMLELVELRKLCPNWDGDSAIVPNEYTIVRAAILLHFLHQSLEPYIPWMNPSIAPLPDGGIDLFWETDEGWVILVVKPEESLMVAVYQDLSESGNEPEHITDVSMKEALRYVRWVLS